MTESVSSETVVLRHLALYRMSIAAAIEAACLDGQSSKNLLARLRNENKIRSVRGAIGKLAYYQLTRTSARVVEAPESRAEEIGPAALPRHLAVLWYCCLSGGNRCRIENDFDGIEGAEELREIPGDDPHCIEFGESSEPAQMQRLFIPGTEQGEEYHITKLKSRIETMRATPVLNDWLEDRTYAFVFLVETEGKREKFLQLIAEEPFAKSLDIRVALAPSPSTLKDFLNDA
jgi:hypothetical protein